MSSTVSPPPALPGGTGGRLNMPGVAVGAGLGAIPEFARSAERSKDGAPGGGRGGAAAADVPGSATPETPAVGAAPDDEPPAAAAP